MPGEEWWARLRELMGKADAIVFVLSTNSVASKVCKEEVDFGSGLNKRIFPVVIADVDWNAVPDGLAKVHSVFFKDESAHTAALEQLLAALLTDIDWVREHTRLGELAARHAKAGSADELLRGTELHAAEAWLARQPKTAPSPTREHYAFIKASRDAADRRRRRLIATATAAILIALAAAGGLMFFSMRANERAAMAQLLDRASQIGAMLEGPNQIEGLIAAVEAADLSRKQFGTIIPGIRGGLLNALERSREVDRWNDPGPQVLDLAVSSDAKTITVLYRRDGDEEGASVLIGGVWTLSGARQRATIMADRSVGAATLCRSGRCFAYRLADRTVVVDRAGATLWQTTDEVGPGAIDSSADGRTLYVGYASGAVAAVDLANGASRPITTAKGAVATLAVSYDGTGLLTVGDDEVRLTGIVSGASQGYARDLCGSILTIEADGRSFLCSRRGGAVMRFSRDKEDGEAIAQTGFFDMQSIAVAPNGMITVSSGNGGAIDVLARDGTARIQGRLYGGENGRIAFLPPGGSLVEIGYLDNEFKVFDVAATTLATASVDVAADARTVSFCPDGERVAWGAFNGRVGTAGRNDTATGWQGHPDEVSQVLCISDGRMLSVGGALKIWSAPDKSVSIGPEGESFRWALLLPDGSGVLAASGKSVWQVPFSGESRKVYDVEIDDIWRGAIEPKSGAVVLGSSGGGSIEVRSLAGAKTAGPFRAHIGFVNAMAVTGWADTFASGGTLGTGARQSLSLWELAGRQRRTVSAHRALVTGLAFDRGSNLLVSAGDDGAVQMWDEALRKVGPDLLRLPEYATTVAAAPMGGRLAAASGNALYFIETSDDALMRRACDRLMGNSRFSAAPGTAASENRVVDICRRG